MKGEQLPPATVTTGERFLDAFAAIERLLRQKARARREDRFYSLVDAVAAKEPAVRRMAVDLREFADPSQRDRP